LKEDHDVTLLTMGETPLADLNTAYGTALEEDEIRMVRIPVPPFLLHRGDALRGFPLVRYCRAHAADFDLLISAYNVMDFGRPGIQYISDFSFDDPLLRALLRDPRDWKSSIRRPGLLRGSYLRAGRFLSGQSRDGWRRNATLANSDWSRKVLGDAFGVESRTVYPPVPGEFSPPAWVDRADGFVSIGRIVPEKRIDRLFDILEKVRTSGASAHFHVVGYAAADTYGRTLANRAAELRDWVSLDGPLYGEAKAAVLSDHKYGLSGCLHEAFGVAVAEMVRAGMIVWVPAGGGQVEIVAHDDLIYENPEDAVRKIDRVRKNPDRQAALRAHLAVQAEKFSATAFTKEIRAEVARFLERS
jgi:glycosyltransferase involved in cell wall biosynthesis